MPLFLQLLDKNPLPAHEGLIAAVVESGQSRMIPSISVEQFKATLQPTLWPILENVSVYGFLIVPLRAQGQVLGTLAMSCTRPEHRYMTADQTFLEDMADRAALAIANARLFRNLQSELIERQRAQTQLAENQAQLAGIIGSAMDAVVTVDADQRVVLFNRAAEGMFGYSATEVVGGPLDRFLPERFRATHQQHILHFSKTHLTTRRMGTLNDLTAVRADGSEFPIEAAISQIEVAGQAFFTVILRDVTERKQAEKALQESLERYRSTLESMLEGCQIIGFDWRYLYINETAARQGHLDREALLGHTMPEMYPGIESTELFAVLRRSMEERIALPMENEFVYPDGSRGWFELNIQPVPEGVFILSTDITERKRAEQERDQFRRHNELLLNSAGEGIYGVDLEGRTTFINPAGAGLLGFAPAELLGTIQHDVVHHTRADGRPYPLSECHIHATLRDGAVHHIEDEVFWRKDGSRFPVEYTSTPVRDEGGRLTGVVVVFTDITERKRLVAQVQGQVERLGILAEASRAFAEAQPDYQALLDLAARKITEALGENCVIRLVSEDGQWLTRAAYYDIEPEELAFTLTYMPDTPLPIHEPRLVQPVLQSPEPLSVPALDPEQLRPYVKPDDQHFLERIGEHSRILVRLSAGGQVLGLMSVARRRSKWAAFDAQDLAMARDLADRAALAISNARLFHSLQVLNATLEERVTERMVQLALLNRDLEAAKDDAVQANRAKSEFLSRMSHELRTPLNAILGFAQVMEMGTLDSEQQEGLGHFLNAGRHLLSLINEVLDITRIETGHLSLSPEPIKPNEIVGEAVDLISPLAAQRNIPIEVQVIPDLYIRADHQRFKQVLLNLLSNAVKYNREGGHITVSYSVLPDPIAGERLRLSVTDTGPGIPADKLGRLFQAFDRLGAEATEVQGTGLGLALSKTLVEAMQGSLGVESAVGQGSTFWGEMPVVEAPSERVKRTGQASWPEGPTETPARTVLYAEDNLSNLRLVEHILAHRPAIKLLTAMQGGLSVELAREHQPDLIVLDLNLPDLHGSQVLSLLQAEPRTASIPVIVISADATPGQAERLLEVGASAYLAKPLDVKQFLEVLDRLLA